MKSRRGHDKVALRSLISRKGGVIRTADSLERDLASRQLEADSEAVVRVTPGQELAMANELAQEPGVSFAAPVYKYQVAFTPNDSRYTNQYCHPLIGSPTAWDSYPASSSIKIAIIDTGVDRTHPDLASAVVGGYNFYSGTPDFSDVHGHGTAVAGVAAAVGNNGIGVCGASFRSPILGIRISDAQGSAYSDTIAAGIRWAADQGAKVLNCSFGPLQGDAVIESAAAYARSRGALLFVSAGNEGAREPSAGSSNIIFVSATDSRDVIASWSTYGPSVRISAPGVSLQSTTRGGSYSNWSGTSFSSPLAAGVTAMAWSVNPAMSAVDLESYLFATSLDLGSSGWDERYGYGRVNAAALMKRAVETLVVPDNAPPTVNVVQPAAGDIGRGELPIEVNAVDNIGVSSVEFAVDGVTIGTDTTAPYSVWWNSDAVAVGSHTLTVRARDARGNVGTATVAISIDRSTLAATSSPAAPIGAVLGIAASEGQGQQLADTSGAANNAVIGMTAATEWRDPRWTAGRVGNGLLFDGINDVVEVPDSANQQVSQAVTVEAWIKINSGGSAYLPVVGRGDWPRRSYQLFLHPNGALYLHQRTAAGGSTAIEAPAGSVTPGLWTHLAATLDSASNTMRMYVSGRLVAQGAMAGPLDAVAGGRTRIGGVESSIKTIVPAFSGAIDQVAVYPRILNAAELTDRALNPDRAPLDSVAPEVRVSSPSSLDHARGTVPVTVEATDLVGVTGVELLIDGSVVQSDVAPPFGFSLGTASLTPGSHSMSARARDAAGNTAMSEPVSFLVDSAFSGTVGNPPPVPSAAMAFYAFTDGSGQVATDTSGSENHGRLGTSASADWSDPAWVAGFGGPGVWFDGLNDVIEVADTPSLQPSTAVSVETFVKVDSTGVGYQALIGRSDWPRRCFQLFIHPNGALFLHQRSATGASASLDVPAGSVTPNEWNHVAAVIDPSRAAMEVYVGGRLVARGATAGALDTLSGGVTRVGAPEPSLASQVAAFRGALDHVAVYARALSPSEISDHATNPLSPPVDSTPPAISIVLPVPNDRGSGVMTVEVQASDNVGVTSVDLLVDGAAVASSSAAPFRLSWDTSQLGAGVRSLVARARDAAGNQASSTAVTVTVATPFAASPTAPPPAPSGAIGFYSFTEGIGQRATDGSAFANHGVLGDSDAAEWSDPLWAVGHAGPGLGFDGLNDRVTIPHSTAMATQSLTLECRVNPSAAGSGWQALIGKSAWPRRAYQVFLHPSGALFVHYKSSSGAAYSAECPAGSVPADAWSHIAVTIDPSKNAIRVFSRGMLVGQGSAGGPLDPLDGTPVKIGGPEAALAGSIPSYRGIVDSVAIYPHALTDDEVLRRATPVNPVLSLSFSEDSGQVCEDSSGEGNHGLLGTSATADDRDPARGQGRIGNGLTFDGGDVVQVNDSASLQPSGAITVEAWVNPSTLGSGWQALIGKSAWPRRAYQVFLHPSGALFVHYKSSSGVAYSAECPAGSVPADAWSHVAVTIDPSKNSIRLFSRGIIVGQGPAGGPLDPLAGIPVRIGGPEPELTGSIPSFRGAVDSVAIYGHALTGDEVLRRATPVNPVMKLSFLEETGQVCEDSSGSGNHGQLGVAAGIDDRDPTRSQGRIGAGLTFDGGDVVRVNDSASLQPSGAITVEFWVNPSATGQGWQAVIGKSAWPRRCFQVFVHPTDGLWVHFVNQAGAGFGGGTSAGSIPAGQWTHVAVVIDSGAGRLSLHTAGVLRSSIVISGSLDPIRDAALLLGNVEAAVSSNVPPFKGSLDEVIIYSRPLTASEISIRALQY